MPVSAVTGETHYLIRTYTRICLLDLSQYLGRQVAATQLYLQVVVIIGIQSHYLIHTYTRICLLDLRSLFLTFKPTHIVTYLCYRHHPPHTIVTKVVLGFTIHACMYQLGDY